MADSENRAKTWSRFGKIAGCLILVAAGLFVLFRAIPRYRFNAIVLHHSASSADNYESIKTFHAGSRGWRDAAYHLILANGSTSVPSGFLEATGRYRLLSYSPATKDHWANLRALHLCIVGNYDNGEVPAGLRSSLAHALRALQEKYGIPDDRILFHRDCNGTACPGRFITKAKLNLWLTKEADKCPPAVRRQQGEVIGSAWTFPRLL
ncbi:MAG: peptidoglycan recognition family protein [Deltaproteobacteria bacterium]|nr:peptidoglycan recognition family protein [Deltaproteobacteria bacterium]